MAMKCFTRRGRFVPRLIAAFSALVLGTSQVLAQAAGWMPPAKQQFFNSNGAPLIGGQVFTYVPNTTSPKNSWQDPNEVTLNSNPVVLDGSGRGLIFGQGNYRQVVQDQNGNTQWDSQTGTLGSATVGSQVNDTAPLGTVIPFTGFTIPTNWIFAAGQPISRSGFPGLLSALTIQSTTVACVNTSTSLGGWNSTAQMAVGEPVEASCVAPGTTISSITNATTIVVSNAASSSTTVTGTVFPWGNGDGSTTFNVPDLRGRTFAGADAMNGTAASRLTSAFYGANASAPAVAGGGQSVTVPTTDTVNVAVTGAVTIHGVSSANPAINNVQPTVTVNYIIKALPFATGLGGVTSFGGLFGDVVCASSLTCTTVSQIPTVACTAATAAQLGCVIPDNVTVKVNGSGFLIATAAGAATNIGIGSTTTSGGTNGNILFDNAGVVGEKAVTGSGSVVLGTSPTIATPTITGTLSISSLTASGTINSTGSFQANGNTQTFPSSAATLAALNVADQTLSGGTNVTAFSLGTVSSGTLTPDCGKGPLEFATNGGPFTLAAPSSDSSCAILFTNNASAGAITFSGFTVGTNTGDALSTTNGAKFVISMMRINSVATYIVKALQ